MGKAGAWIAPVPSEIDPVDSVDEPVLVDVYPESARISLFLLMPKCHVFFLLVTLYIIIKKKEGENKCRPHMLTHSGVNSIVLLHLAYVHALQTNGPTFQPKVTKLV